jgi:Uma2 family endonuclease
MAGAVRQKATLADFLAIPEETRFHELIDGEIVEKAAPHFDHGDAQSGTTEKLRGNFQGPPSGGRPGGWWIVTEVEVLLGENVYRPDVTGWRRDTMPVRPKEFPVRARPDWVCEVVSPHRPNHDTVKKVRAYQQAGIPHYWLLDLRDGTLTVLRHSLEGYVVALKAERGEKVRAEPFDAIELAVVDLLGGE